MAYGKRRNYKKMAKSSRRPKQNGLKAKKYITNPYLVKVIKRLVKKQQEIKTVTSTLFPRINADGIMKSSGINNQLATPAGATCDISIIPAVGQGTAQGQRNGNKISPVSLLIRGVVNALPTSATASGTNYYPNMPLYVRIVVYCLRSNATINNNDLLLDQGTSNKNFDGSLSDLMLPYNQERFKIVKSRQYNLQPVYANSDPSGQTENTNKRTSKMFKMYVKLPKTLTYADNVNDNNKTRYYIAAGVVNYDGTLIGTNDARARIYAEAVLKFRDS